MFFVLLVKTVYKTRMSDLNTFKENNAYTQYIEYLKSVVHPEGTKLYKHRILPRHDGGDYTESNVIVCTYKQHRLAQLLRFYVYKQAGDSIAYRFMKGQTEEAKLDMARFAGSRGGPAASKAHKEKATLFYSPEWQMLHGDRKGGQRNV